MDMSFAQRRKTLPVGDADALARALASARARQAATHTAQVHALSGLARTTAHADPLVEVFAPEGKYTRLVTCFSADAQATLTRRQSP